MTALRAIPLSRLIPHPSLVGTETLYIGWPRNRFASPTGFPGGSARPRKRHCVLSFAPGRHPGGAQEERTSLSGNPSQRTSKRTTELGRHAAEAADQLFIARGLRQERSASTPPEDQRELLRAHDIWSMSCSTLGGFRQR